jgi:1-acyl-sn-glycerol-3-phosphate acyltransferase
MSGILATVRHGRIGAMYRFAVSIIKPTSLSLTKRDWSGAENIPAEGGVIVAANHLSYIDPLTFGHFVWETGRVPRFLAKSTLFEVPLLKYVFTGTNQIPVHRGTADASQALSAAVDALKGGECILIYPEGSATRDPDGWPMRARTGVARLALMSGVPVVPVAQWGPQELWKYRTKRPHPFPRKTMHVLAGPPVDLSAYADHPQDTQTLREVTELVMQRITEQLATLRHQTPPSKPYDPRVAA